MSYASWTSKGWGYYCVQGNISVFRGQNAVCRVYLTLLFFISLPLQMIELSQSYTPEISEYKVLCYEENAEIVPAVYSRCFQKLIFVIYVGRSSDVL